MSRVGACVGKRPRHGAHPAARNPCREKLSLVRGRQQTWTAALPATRSAECSRPHARHSPVPRPAAAIAAAPPGAAAAAGVAVTAEPAPYEELAILAGEAERRADVRTTPLGRGLVASQDADREQALVSVPVANALVIADDPTSGPSIFSDKLHRQAPPELLPPPLLEFLQGDARWDARMTAWLLWAARRPPSPLWAAYLSLLPREPEMSCLLNFSRDELLELQVPSLQAEAAVQADWAAHLHNRHFSSAGGQLAALGLSGSLGHSLWALSLVRSRTFSEDVNGEALTLMVPFADLANHSFDHNSTFHLSTDRRSFQLRPLRRVAAGEEVTISYGADKPNAELLRDYGFTTPGNPHDRVRFSVPEASAGAAGKQQQQQQQLLGLNPVSLLEATGFVGDLEGGDIQPSPAPGNAALPPDQALRLARRRSVLLSVPLAGARPPSGGGSGGSGLFGWLDAAAQPWTAAGRAPPVPLQRNQAAAERAAARALQQEALRQLAQLPTSLVADEALLLQEQERERERPRARAGGGAAGAPQAAPRSRERFVAAVRARLEHKQLLREAVAALLQYEDFIAARFG